MGYYMSTLNPISIINKISLSFRKLLKSRQERLSAHVPDHYFSDRSDIQNVFSSIYSHQIWGEGSGGGSTLAATKAYVNFLQSFIDSNKIQSVLDIGCGDWRFSAFVNWTNIEYLGLDVVPTVIETNIQRHAKNNIHFKCQNPLDEDFKMPKVDLVIMKDVLQHLSNQNISKMIHLVKQAKFCLITNDYARKNADTLNGDTRPLNLLAAPFNLNGEEVLIFGDKRTILIVN
jgi:SAM-dependent methyltransferase